MKVCYNKNRKSTPAGALIRAESCSATLDPTSGCWTRGSGPRSVSGGYNATKINCLLKILAPSRLLVMMMEYGTIEPERQVG